MRIGIITFWESDDNYGQVLQCWALQQYLKSLGHEPFLIRYKVLFEPSAPSKPLYVRIAKALLLFPIFTRYYKRKKIINGIRLSQENEKLNVQRKFKDFRDHYIVQSEVEYIGLDSLQKNPPQADIYITGSDQVWGLLLDKKEHEAYFLNFGDKKMKRASYAASFSRKEYPIALQGKLQEMLKKFDYISVREKEGVEIVRKLGFKAEHTIDPTLLLNKSDYSNALGLKSFPSKGILIYSLNYSSKKDIPWKKIKNYATAKNEKITVITGSGYIPARKLFEGVDYCYATIPQWIEMISSSSLIVTSSFHGIVFCIIFHKHFIYVPIKGEHSKGNSRIIELLDELGLEGMIWEKKKFIETYANSVINWLVVEKRLNQIKQKSLTFLDDIMKE